MEGWERSRFHGRVVRVGGNAAVGAGVRSRWSSADGGTISPNLLELGGCHVGAILSSDRGPKGSTTSFVDGSKTVRIDRVHSRVKNALVGVDTETRRFGRGTRGQLTGLGEQDLVLGPVWRGVDGAILRGSLTSVVDRRALARDAHGILVVLDIAVLRHGGVTVGARRGVRGDGGSPLAAVASVRELVIVETASKLRLLEVGSDMLVGHLLHSSLEEVVLLQEMGH